MAGHVQVNTPLMQTVAKKSDDSAFAIIGHAEVLKSGLDYVTRVWQGQAGDSFRAATAGQSAMLDKLIRRLQEVAQQVQHGGQGFEVSDAEAKQKTDAAAQQFLSVPINFGH